MGKTGIFRGGRAALFAGYLIRIHRDPTRIDPDYLNYFLNSQLARNYGKTVMGQSVNQANISASKLKNYSLALPPLEAQRTIVATLHAIKAKTTVAASLSQQKLTALAELKQSILHKAFTGELTAEPKAANRVLAEGI